MSMVNLLEDAAFSLSGLTASVNNLPLKPGKLGALGLFEEQGITTTTANVEVQDNQLSLVDVMPRGSSGQPGDKANRQVIPFAIPHIPQRDTVLADTIQNVRAFGTENQFQAIQQVINQRMMNMRNNNEYTLESHRVAAIQGQYFDAAGNQKSLFTAFGVSEQTVPFALATDTTDVRAKCTSVLDAIESAMGGVSFERAHVVCSKTFFDDLIKHPNVEKFYLNSVSNSEVRGEMRTTFEFGGLTFERYNGTTDVKIADGEARAFPVGSPDTFITRFAPANYSETVNTIGLPVYAKMEAMSMGKGFDLEVQSNPLNLCTRPKALIKLKRTAT